MKTPVTPLLCTAKRTTTGFFILGYVSKLLQEAVCLSLFFSSGSIPCMVIDCMCTSKKQSVVDINWSVSSLIKLGGCEHWRG